MLPEMSQLHREPSRHSILRIAFVSANLARRSARDSSLRLSRWRSPSAGQRGLRMPDGAPSRRRAASATAAAAAASPTASPGPAGDSAATRSERDLLESILLKLPDSEKVRSDKLAAAALRREMGRKGAQRERRLARLNHLSEAGGALAIVAALVGGIARASRGYVCPSSRGR